MVWSDYNGSAHYLYDAVDCYSEYLAAWLDAN